MICGVSWPVVQVLDNCPPRVVQESCGPAVAGLWTASMFSLSPIMRALAVASVVSAAACGGKILDEGAGSTTSTTTSSGGGTGSSGGQGTSPGAPMSGGGVAPTPPPPPVASAPIACGKASCDG